MVQSSVEIIRELCPKVIVIGDNILVLLRNTCDSGLEEFYSFIQVICRWVEFFFLLFLEIIIMIFFSIIFVCDSTHLLVVRIFEFLVAFLSLFFVTLKILLIYGKLQECFFMLSFKQLIVSLGSFLKNFILLQIKANSLNSYALLQARNLTLKSDRLLLIRVDNLLELIIDLLSFVPKFLLYFIVCTQCSLELFNPLVSKFIKLLLKRFALFNYFGIDECF